MKRYHSSNAGQGWSRVESPLRLVGRSRTRRVVDIQQVAGDPRDRGPGIVLRRGLGRAERERDAQGEQGRLTGHRGLPTVAPRRGSPG